MKLKSLFIFLLNFGKNIVSTNPMDNKLNPEPCVFPNKNGFSNDTINPSEFLLIVVAKFSFVKKTAYSDFILFINSISSSFT